MNANSDLSVVNGGFTSREEARTFADRLVAACITSHGLVQEMITDALIETQRAIEAKYRNSLAIPEGWRLIAVREPRFDEYFVSDDCLRVEYQDGGVSFRGRNPTRLIVERVTQPDPQVTNPDGEIDDGAKTTPESE